MNCAAMVILLMGVAGSGKTTIGLLLAQELKWDFYDADDFHPPGNIDKIQRGLALHASSDSASAMSASRLS